MNQESILAEKRIDFCQTEPTLRRGARVRTGPIRIYFESLPMVEDSELR